jgi:hypothetical protein
VKQRIATKAITTPQLYAPNIVADVQPMKVRTSHCIAVLKGEKKPHLWACSSLIPFQTVAQAEN